MAANRLLAEPAAVMALSEKLARYECVTRDDQGESMEASTLAYTLGELEEYFTKFLTVDLPRLVTEDLTESEMERVLWGMRDDFRNVLYEMRNPKEFRLLFGPELVAEE